jgi:hypothetical protein
VEPCIFIREGGYFKEGILKFGDKGFFLARFASQRREQGARSMEQGEKKKRYWFKPATCLSLWPLRALREETVFIRLFFCFNRVDPRPDKSGKR